MIPIYYSYKGARKQCLLWWKLPSHTSSLTGRGLCHSFRHSPGVKYLKRTTHNALLPFIKATIKGLSSHAHHVHAIPLNHFTIQS